MSAARSAVCGLRPAGGGHTAGAAAWGRRGALRLEAQPAGVAALAGGGATAGAVRGPSGAGAANQGAPAHQG